MAGRFKKELENLLFTVEPHSKLKKWVKGYIPSEESYVRNSIPVDERMKLAKIGFTEFYINFGVQLYFTQSLIVGALISGRYSTGRVIATPRYGKSFIEGGLAVLLAKDDYSVSIVSDKGSRTSKVMEHARAHLRHSLPQVRNMLVEDEKRAMSKADRLLTTSETAFSRSKIIFKNGNKIDTKTTGDSFNDSTRNNEAIGDGTHVLVDEMDFLSEESLAELGRREFETDSGRKLVLFGISNPRFHNHFFRAVRAKNLAKDEFVIHMNVRTALEEDNIKMTTDEVLESEFAKTEDSIRINLLCTYDEEKSEFFDTPMIIKSKRHLNTISDDTIAVLGIDSAYTGSDGISVCLMLYDTNYYQPIKVIDIANLKPEDWDNARSTRDIVDAIEGLSKMYPIKAIATDVGQGSHIIVGLAERESLKHIKQYSVNFGSKPTPEKVKAGIDTAVLARNKRAEMYLSLRQVMQEERICFSREIVEDLKDQMLATMTVQKEMEKVQIIDKGIIKSQLKKSPDELDSTVLALHALELLLLGVESR